MINSFCASFTEIWSLTISKHSKAVWASLHIHILTHRYQRMHAHTHARTHARARTHTHTHTLYYGIFPCLLLPVSGLIPIWFYLDKWTPLYRCWWKISYINCIITQSSSNAFITGLQQIWNKLLLLLATNSMYVRTTLVPLGNGSKDLSLSKWHSLYSGRLGNTRVAFNRHVREWVSPPKRSVLVGCSVSGYI